MSGNEASARAFVGALASGDFAGATRAFDETVRAAMPSAVLEQTWVALTGQVGAFERIESVRSEAAGPHDVVFVTVVFAATRLDVKLVFDQKDAIAGLFFVPAALPYAPPSYADVARVEDRAVVVGVAPWELPGTLTLPKPAAGSRVPAVVLVHGSGPSDRDETIGACKPFRDLALGLATLGIAVLAYDKRTRVHGAKLAELERFTVLEECVQDACLLYTSRCV